MVSTDKKRRRTKKRTKITSRLIYGALLLTPLGVTLLIMRWFFGWVAGFIQPIVVTILKGLSYIPFIQSIPQIPTAICVTVITIIVMLFFVYVVGSIGQRVVGKRLLKAGETLLLRIPMVKTIYSATKQVIDAISMPDKAAFKSVVLVEFPRPGFKAIGFLTGHIRGIEGETLYKIFIPTTPNPTTGFFEIIPPEEVIETNLTIEEAFKMIISGGMVAPDTLEALGTSKSTNNSKQTEHPYAKSKLT